MTAVPASALAPVPGYAEGTGNDPAGFGTVRETFR